MPALIYRTSNELNQDQIAKLADRLLDKIKALSAELEAAALELRRIDREAETLITPHWLARWNSAWAEYAREMEGTKVATTEVATFAEDEILPAVILHTQRT